MILLAGEQGLISHFQIAKALLSTTKIKEVTDNFVFKTMKKAKLWDDGVKISAVLYRRKARSPYNMPIQQRK